MPHWQCKVPLVKMSNIQAVQKSYTLSPMSEPLISTDLARFLCGGIAGAVSRTVTAPVDRLKVLRQLNVHEVAGKNMYQGFRTMVHEGGILALWRGNGVNVLKNCPECAIRFSLHGWLKSVLFPNAKGPLQPEQRFFVACVAGASSLTITYPLEVMKTRMAMRRSTDSSSIIVCFRTVLKEGGLRGFYRGYKVSMFSYVPYSGMELALYEMLKRKYIDLKSSWYPGLTSTEKNHMPTYVAVPLVIISCCIPMPIIYPANLLRTRYQASPSPMAAPVFLTIRSIVRTDGWTGLYRGLSTSLSKTLPSVCITYCIFEFCSELMRVPGLGSK